MHNLFGGCYNILCGVDTLAMEDLCLVADGWVAGLVCAFLKETVAIYRLSKAGSELVRTQRLTLEGEERKIIFENY